MAEGCVAVVDGGNVRLLLIALFAVLGEWYLATAVRALWRREKGDAGRALSAALLVLMSAVMISMFWSAVAVVPAIAQVTVFTAAAGWFTGQAVFGTGAGHVEASYENWYHAGMMAAMVWIAVVVPLMSVPSAGGGMTGMPMTGGAMTGGAMAGMTMGGQAPAAGETVAAMSAADSSGWARTVCLVLAVVFFAAAAWQAVAALRPLAVPGQGRAPAPLWRDGAGVVLRDGFGSLMAAGLAVALLELT